MWKPRMKYIDPRLSVLGLMGGSLLFGALFFARPAALADYAAAKDGVATQPTCLVQPQQPLFVAPIVAPVAALATQNCGLLSTVSTTPPTQAQACGCGLVSLVKAQPTCLVQPQQPLFVAPVAALATQGYGLVSSWPGAGYQGYLSASPASLKVAVDAVSPAGVNVALSGSSAANLNVAVNGSGGPAGVNVALSGSNAANLNVAVNGSSGPASVTVTVSGSTSASPVNVTVSLNTASQPASSTTTNMVTPPGAPSVSDSDPATTTITPPGAPNLTDTDDPIKARKANPNAGPKGNNGVGNGLDPQPPGNPPINDGEGTGPGNPGNKGGSKKTSYPYLNDQFRVF